MNKLFTILLSVLVFFCCSLQKNKNVKDVSNLYKIIYKSDYTGSAKKSFRIIRNEDDYRVYFIGLKEQKVPEVDFKKSNILVLNLGRKPSGGYSVIPEKLIQDGEKLILMIKENSPKKGELVTTALTNPVCVLKIDSKKDLIIK